MRHPLADYLHELACILRDGGELDPHQLARAALVLSQQLEDVFVELEEDPAPEGLESLDDATRETANLYAEAAEWILRANTEVEPAYAEKALLCLQEAVDTLRMMRQQVDETRRMLEEETGEVL